MVTFDGKGNASVNSWLSQGGVISEVKATGTYTVNPDCTMRPIGGDPGVIVDGGKELYLITALEGRNIFAVSKKQ